MQNTRMHFEIMLTKRIFLFFVYKCADYVPIWKIYILNKYWYIIFLVFSIWFLSVFFFFFFLRFHFVLKYIVIVRRLFINCIGFLVFIAPQNECHSKCNINFCSFNCFIVFQRFSFNHILLFVSINISYHLHFMQ